MKNARLFIACTALTVWASGCFSQNMVQPLPQQRVTLGASAHVQVAQDWLTMSLSTTREGAEPQVVQNQLKVALEAALMQAKKQAQAGQMDVHTGRFGLSPRYGRDGKLTGWQGSAELVLEGCDFARISETAGKLQTLTVASSSFGLSSEQRQSAQTQAQGQAIAQFRQRASEIAKSFDFSSYTLGEINVSSDDQGSPMRPMMMAARAVASDSPVPVEAGLSTVTVTVSGSVQLK